MKLVIGEREYDIATAMQETSLEFVRRFTRTCGFGMKTLGQRMDSMSELDDPSDMMEDPDMLDAFCALVWLVRTHAGEKLTLEQAGDFDVSAVGFRREDGDEPPEPADPTPALTVTGQGDDLDQDAEPTAATV